MKAQTEGATKWLQASYTIEAAIYVPMILFLLMQTIDIAIDRWQICREREVYKGLRKLDIVQEFYGYQILEEVREEIVDD